MEGSYILTRNKVQFLYLQLLSMHPISPFPLGWTFLVDLPYACENDIVDKQIDGAKVEVKFTY